MLADIKDIIIAIITTVGVVLSAWLGLKIKEARSSPKIHPLVTTNITISLRSFSIISGIVKHIFQKTSADRFLILSAHNGRSPLKYATAFFEQHDDHVKDAVLSIGAVSKYVKFEFDKEYLRILKEVELNGKLLIDVEKMPDCDLKTIYKNEKIRYSKIYFLHRQENHDGKGNDLLIYCSLAKHKEPIYTDEERLVFKYSVPQIADLIKNTF
jgi:hypothetical protein